MKISPVRIIPYVSGALMTLNFFVFWAAPIAGMGMLWKHVLKGPLMPLYDKIDQNPTLRRFAEDYIYSQPRYADYFTMSLIVTLNSALFIGILFYWQLSTGSLPLWLVYLYYCSWVGLGGRIMGCAYSFAHKEGHNQNLYKKWLKNSVGHFFENWLGVFFGNVPWNFTTSHIFIHHRLDGGAGDTFYMWDIDRTNPADFLLYVHRIFLHMTGYSSLKFFSCHNHAAKEKLLTKGVITYWVTAAAILAITRSFSFTFFFYLQPLFCMTYFLGFINVGFHAFIEYDENGKSIGCVNATAIVNGDDDTYGEDDHMAHHYATSVFYRDLPAHQASQVEEYKRHKASVFKGVSVVELSVFIMCGLWDEVAKAYVDFTGEMTKEEIITMLKARAKRTEMSYESYHAYLMNPTPEARKSMTESIIQNNMVKKE
jgi:hypothetical protein